jgi:hypothetical protein
MGGGTFSNTYPHHGKRRVATMKITNVTATLWEWKDIPPTRYNKEIATDSGSTEMALVTTRPGAIVAGDGATGAGL